MNREKTKDLSETDAKEELLKLSEACETASLEEMRKIVATALRILSDQIHTDY